MSFFITIEGIEGSGKSTLLTRLADSLKVSHREVVTTREPGATSLGKSIRQIVLDPENKTLSPTAELLLFAADRAQHLDEVIRPALKRGAIVVCDRFLHSTLAYQGYGRGIDLKKLEFLHEFICKDTLPNLVLLLDLPAEIGLKRAASRAGKSSGNDKADSSWNRFEQQELDFHTKVRNGFLALAADQKQNIVTIDAQADKETIFTTAIEAVAIRLKETS